MRVLIFLWIVLLILSMHTSFRTYSQMQSNPVDNLRLLRIVVMCVVALWAIGPLLPMKKLDFAFKPPITYVFIYGIMGLISTIYAPVKTLTAWKSVEILVDSSIATVIAFYLLDSNPKKFLDIVHITIGFLIIIMEIEAIIFPARAFRWYEEGPMRRQLGGVYPSMNPIMFGYICSFVSVMSISSLINRYKSQGRRLLYIILFVSAITGTILSHSRTGGISAILGILFVLIMNRKFTLSGVIIIFALANILVPQMREYWLRTQTVEQFSTMTGRTIHWQWKLKMAMESPIIGHGFYSSMRAMINSDTTDNLYLDVFFGLGGVGLSFMVFMIIAVWKDTLKIFTFANKINEPEMKEFASKILGVMLILTVSSITGRGFAIHGESFMMFMTLIISIQAFKYGDWVGEVEERVDDQMEPAI